RKTTRQYNSPTVSEVAAIIINDFGDAHPTRDIVVERKDTGPQRVSELHPSYMALQYPLLFPYGEDGFHEKIPYHSNAGTRKTKRGYITMKEYYSYIIQQRPNQGNTLLKGGRLFQQYLVDAYTAVEEQRLKWTRHNQDTLRVDLYHNLCDAITRGDTSAVGLGKRIVLPRTFTGSPRYMMNNYQDAMALCRAYGNPDLFITFTSNPKWPEISEMLAYFPGQKPHDRPEIGTRVFKIKLTELLHDLTQKHVFGETRAVVYVIEFQKRGLPHAHILLWLEEHSKCKTPAEVDDIISAEIPFPDSDPDGYKVVTDYMLHGPCGKDARNAACTSDGKCSKHFPKPFLAETFLDEDGYPHYRRRDNKVTFKKGNFIYDNKHVVPHNRYLLLKYRAHINVEWCNRSKAIKYLFKYLNKGPDRATIVIEENVKNGTTVGTENVLEVDEIKNYLNCRFLAPCEAVWRLFSFDIHYTYPSIMQLTFHLTNQNAITMRDSKRLPALLQREGIDVTMFTDLFELNKCDPDARTLTYADIPKHYVWHEQSKLWKKRKQRKCIGRIVYSSPASGERYYLRMLLNVVRGVFGFEELMTVNRRVCATFKEACFEYGLLHDDKEWSHAIAEASLWALGPQLRDIFVTMLIFCDVSRPQKLWEENWQTLSEDILAKKRKLFNYPNLQLTNEQIRNYCLIEIKELLHKYGRSLSDFKDLPQPDPRLLTNMDNRLIREALDFDIKKSRAEHQHLHSLLNPEQRIIYDDVVQSVHNKKGNFYFVYGPGGTGKTFLYKTIISRLRSDRMIVLAVASSGIASLLLPAGRTAHSRFVIPLELMENSTCGIKKAQPSLEEKWQLATRNGRRHFRHGSSKMSDTNKISRKEALRINKGQKKTRHICPPHENTKRDPGSKQRKVQTSSSNDNTGRKAVAFDQRVEENNGKDQAKVAKKGEATGKDKPLAILMVQTRRKITKQRITQTFSPETMISFPPLGEEDGTEGPMVIEAEVGGHLVHRMYVDGGASSKILYEHCFNQLCPEIRNQMVPATTYLVGFSGEIIWPLGQVSLLVKIGDEEHSTSAWMNFMVVRSYSSYNGIIGRPGIRRIKAIPSTAHRMLKFPMTGGTGTEEKIQVAIHPEYPEQTIAIGSTLTEEGQKKLCGLLRQNLDIFAWKPADMTGVPRHIAEHRLNVREGCFPVRQKKRGQASERNKAICEEVEKLVNAGIMKEVHYHSWLSNPVMVKKHDNNWRMCVDFKDLNKACLKDGYPLPEIDWKVESLCGYPLKCFMDAYKGYHQIKMAKEDEEKTAFITSQGIFCYSKMPVGLKNAGATYQRLVDKGF
ncbi:ATP-dependent DNA helicase PIF1, partial [Tanacetum coccineum]